MLCFLPSPPNFKSCTHRLWSTRAWLCLCFLITRNEGIKQSCTTIPQHKTISILQYRCCKLSVSIRNPVSIPLVAFVKPILIFAIVKMSRARMCEFLRLGMITYLPISKKWIDFYRQEEGCGSKHVPGSQSKPRPRHAKHTKDTLPWSCYIRTIRWKQLIVS